MRNGEQGNVRKLSNEQIRFLRSRAASLKDLSIEWNMSETVLWRARARETYKDVD